MREQIPGGAEVGSGASMGSSGFRKSKEKEESQEREGAVLGGGGQSLPSHHPVPGTCFSRTCALSKESRPRLSGPPLAA